MNNIFRHIRARMVRRIGVGLLIVAAGATAWFVAAASIERGTPGTAITLEVHQDETLNQIAHNAEAEGLVANDSVLRLYALVSGRARSLKPGSYEFLLPVSVREVVVSLVAGGVEQDEVQVVIPEGFTVKQITERLAEASVAGAENFSRLNLSSLRDEFAVLASAPAMVQSLEGYLFPDTYRFKKDSPAEDIARRLIRTFTERTTAVREQVVQENKNLYNVLTLASILEREVPPEDMPVAAGILLKRMEAGVALQVDATLVYALGRPIVRDDIDTLDSLYNTYQHRGLPPTPIANPGLAALEAALNPVESPYWYYLSRSSDGETIFSRTLDEHNAARAKYLR